MANFDKMAANVWVDKYGQDWCLCKEQEKCRHPVKADWKKSRWLKSYGQNKIFYEKRVKNGRFPLYFCPKLKIDGPRPRKVGKL